MSKKKPDDNDPQEWEVVGSHLVPRKAWKPPTSDQPGWTCVGHGKYLPNQGA